MKMINKFIIGSLTICSTLIFSGCGANKKDTCDSIKIISSDLASAIGALSNKFSQEQNTKLALSLKQLRDLSSSSSSISQPKVLLENSIEDLMSNALAGDKSAAAKNVNDMTVAIQSLTSACNQ